MSIKSLLLGSIAAAGLSTSAFAADLSVVLTSLDVCDSLGIVGLTISSDRNCLEGDGGFSYDLNLSDMALVDVTKSEGFGSIVTLGVDTFDDDGIDEVVLTVAGPSGGGAGGAMIIYPGDSGGYTEELVFEQSVTAFPFVDSDGDTLFGDELGVLPTTMKLGAADTPWDPAMPIVTDFGPAWHVDDFVDMKHALQSGTADGRAFGAV